MRKIANVLIMSVGTLLFINSYASPVITYCPSPNKLLAAIKALPQGAKVAPGELKLTVPGTSVVISNADSITAYLVGRFKQQLGLFYGGVALGLPNSGMAPLICLYNYMPVHGGADSFSFYTTINTVKFKPNKNTSSATWGDQGTYNSCNPSIPNGLNARVCQFSVTPSK